MTDWGWVSRELAAGNVGGSYAEVVVALLRELDKQSELYEFTDDDKRVVLDATHKLALGYSIAVPKKDERWGPVVPGYYQVKDTVRVKNDAYDGPDGRKHNGKRGRVVAARDGFVLVVYEDAPSADIQHRHRPEKLQRLM